MLRLQREDPNSYQDLLRKPYEISNSLRIKCRDNLEDTIRLLKDHQIVPRIDKTFIYPDENIEKQMVSLIKAKTVRKDVENLENLYKNLRVCKLCYTVYCLMSKYFDKQTTQLEKTIHNTHRPYSTAGHTQRSKTSNTSVLASTQRDFIDEHRVSTSEVELPPIAAGTKRSSNSSIDLTNARKSKVRSSHMSMTDRSHKSIINDKKGNATSTTAVKDLLEKEGRPASGRGPSSLKNLSDKKGSEPKIGLKRSNSTIANSRLLHGILQKVTQPEVLEIEKKLMVERELLKKEEKREGRYIPNLLELVLDKKLLLKQEAWKAEAGIFLVRWLFIS